MDIKIAIACHKPSPLPADPSGVYLPLCVGHALHPGLDLGIQTDDTGLNRSAENGCLCELTAIYWLWKNSAADFKGLFHYRRYLSLGMSHRGRLRYGLFRLMRRQLMPVSKVGEKEFLRMADGFSRRCPQLCERYDILSTQPCRYTCSVAEFFNEAVGRYLPIMNAILAERFPEYASTMNALLASRSMTFGNISVMRSDIFDRYCTMLFGVIDAVIEEVERSDDPNLKADFLNRKAGYLGELLTACFIETEHRRGLRVKQLPVAYLR